MDPRIAKFNIDQAQRIVRTVRRMEALPVNNLPGGQGNGLDIPPFWALLTAEDTGSYKWKRQVYASASDTWVDLGTASTDFTATEVNGTQGLTGDRVLLYFSGQDSDGTAVYLFSSGDIPVGMYPGMIYQVTAANTGGWDWEHAHSLI